MTREEAREKILERAKEHFKPDKSGRGYICPICGSGSGDKGTGLTENPKSPGHFTCWTGCFTNADIFEIIGQQFNIPDYNGQFEKCCDIFGITLDKPSQSSGRVVKNKKQSGHVPNVVAASDTSPAMTDTNEDYTEFFKMAAQHIADTDYHRGISLETLQRFGVGFVSQWEHPTTAKQFPGTYLSPRLIVPNDNGGYLARDTRQNLTVEQERYQKQHVKPNGLFNGQALKQSSAPVFVVEGAVDALSIIDAGGEAVALCSTTNASKLIEAVKTQRPKVPLILVPDNDMAGQNGMERVAEGLRQIEFSSYRQHELPSQYKDANAFLMGDREGFMAWVKAGIREACEEGTGKKEAFERKSAAYALNRFIEMVNTNRGQSAISTGFSNLDGLLDGGLYPGLHVIGAVSGLGKSSLCLHITDNLARSGYGVLYFSLEMAGSELIAKSLSRLTFLESYERYGTADYGKTAREILRGDFTTKKEQEVVLNAIKEYSDFGRNIYFFESTMNFGVGTIRKETEGYINIIGQKPVIIVDYIQILASPNQKRSLTDKQMTDINVAELKRISRDFDVPLLAISSFNRDSYTLPVDKGAYKESGAIEYDSDVLIGLQYYGWDYSSGEKAKDGVRAERLRLLQAKNKEAGKKRKNQEIQLKVLKARFGTEDDCRFDFWPAFTFFKEV